MALICAKNTKSTIKKIGKNNELPQKCTITSTNKWQDYNIIPTKTMRITSKLHYNIERKTETYSKYTILYWKQKSSEVDFGVYFEHLRVDFGPLGVNFRFLEIDFWPLGVGLWASGSRFFASEGRFWISGSQF